jgi:hypothetical protein
VDQIDASTLNELKKRECGPLAGLGTWTWFTVSQSAVLPAETIAITPALSDQTISSAIFILSANIRGARSESSQASTRPLGSPNRFCNPICYNARYTTPLVCGIDPVSERHTDFTTINIYQYSKTLHKRSTEPFL